MAKESNIKTRTNIASYITGFLFSIILTSASYILVEQHVVSFHRAFSHDILVPVIMTLALTQLVVQLIFFLHLGQESKPRWNLIFFISTVSIILIVIVGSLWIMQHLNYNMTPKEINTYMEHQEGILK